MDCRSAERHQEDNGRLFAAKPVRIQAYKLISDELIETLEGLEQARAGDWVITGIRGEKYPIAEDRLFAKYKRISQNEFEKIPVQVRARQTDCSVDLPSSWGVMHADVADWIVTDLDTGDKRVVSGKLFEDLYEPVQ